METLLTLAVSTTQPSAQRPVSDLPASGFYWFVALGGLLTIVLAWIIIKYAVLAALRTHAKDKP